MTAPIDIYTRVSQLADTRMLSTDGQEADCRTRAAEEGLALGQVHSDPGRSAWNPRVKRPGWDALMSRLESGAAGGVIVFDLARFTRRPKEGERLIDAAERGLIVLDSEHRFDLTSPDGKAAFRDHMKMAAYESDRLSTRVRRGKRTKAGKGEVDARRSFGFESDGVTVHESEAAIIRGMAARLLAGETQDSLLSELRARGVPTVGGAEWGYTTFRQVMTRPRNAGYVAHKGEIVDGVRLPGEPILDESAWRRIVALYAARKPGRPPSGRYLLTGIVVCGQAGCGAPLAGRPVTGTQRRQYWCKKCRKTFVDVRPLEAHTGILAARLLGDPHHAAAIERAVRANADECSKVKNEIASCEELASVMAARLGRGEITLSRYDTVTEPLEVRLGVLRGQLSALDDREAEPVPQRTIQEWTERYAAANPGERRAMILTALQGRKLIVGPGKPARFDPRRVTVS